MKLYTPREFFALNDTEGKRYIRHKRYIFMCMYGINHHMVAGNREAESAKPVVEKMLCKPFEKSDYSWVYGHLK